MQKATAVHEVQPPNNPPSPHNPLAPFGKGEARSHDFVLAHHQSMLKKKAVYLFESSWNRKYSERGIRKMLRRYAEGAGISTPISPHKLRHFLLLSNYGLKSRELMML